MIYMAVDDSGNMLMETFTITVEDVEEPAISGLPDQLTIDSEPGLCSAAASWAEPVSTDRPRTNLQSQRVRCLHCALFSLQGAAAK